MSSGLGRANIWRVKVQVILASNHCSPYHHHPCSLSWKYLGCLGICSFLYSELLLLPDSSETRTSPLVYKGTPENLLFSLRLSTKSPSHGTIPPQPCREKCIQTQGNSYSPWKGTVYGFRPKLGEKMVQFNSRNFQIHI